ncbi:FHIPEP family type III secretion protein [bacterium]|nr:FHIPEP family type III secretion protein [bacterium]
MKKHVNINGDLVRQQREKRAWTQEQLSERTNLGLRTVRRLESGSASWESLLKVAEELGLEPESTLVEPQLERKAEQRQWFLLDPLKIEVSTSLLSEDPMNFVRPLMDKIKVLRQTIAREWGWLMPGVRLCDSTTLPHHGYRIYVRELPAGEGQLEPDRLLQVERRVAQPGDVLDPIWSLPARWVEASEPGLTPQAVLANHLRSLIELHAHRLLGMDEVSDLLDGLENPRLLEEVVPGKIDLTGLRWILRDLLREFIPIRDLPAILESIADHSGLELPQMAEKVRADLAPLISHLHSDDQRTIHAVVYERLPRQLEPIIQTIFVTTPELRRPLREMLREHPRCPVLSLAEIAPGYSLSAIFSEPVVN